MTDIGYCEKHSRAFEGFCKNCEVLVCASCVLFADHKKHDIVSLVDGEAFMRSEIDKKIKSGLLKKEYSEGNILEIREYSLKLEKYKNETVKKIDDAFKKLINLLKDRKTNISNEILEKFGEEKEKVLFEEGRWIEKQDISERLLNLLSDKNSVNLLINSKYIMEGIRTLNEKLEFKEMKVYNDLDTSLNFSKEINKQEVNISLGVEDICSYFSDYIHINNPNVLEYKA